MVSGAADRTFFIRSAAKPFQASVCLGLGAPLPPQWLALACASHDGDPVHVAIVADMLASVGLSESDLKCPPARPHGRGSGRLSHNCSGKHAAMLMACRVQGWSTEDYLDPRHPLQQAIAAEMVSIGGPGVLPVGIDGCGAPVFRVDTIGLADFYHHLVAEMDEVFAAMARYPALVSGVGNTDSEASIWLGGVAKRGAEGCIGVALPGRGALGIKVWDGNDGRALPVALLAALDHLGWMPAGARRHLEEIWARSVLGRGVMVGTVRADLFWEGR